MKTTLSIDASKARELYNAGCGAVKTILEESFGKNFFKVDVRDRVKTYEDALCVLGIRRNANHLSSVIPAHVVAYMKLCTIIEALNEGWEPDWDNKNQAKHYLRFRMSPSSFAFYCSDDEFTSAYAGSSSRLCLKSEKLSDYCGTQFLDLWKEFMLK